MRYGKAPAAGSQDILIDAETCWREAKATGRSVLSLAQPTQPQDRQAASFIGSLTRSPADKVMVQAIIQVCQAHGVQTLAEFVEDEETLELLSEMGVDFAQEYLVGKPRSVASLAAPRRTRSMLAPPRLTSSG